MLDLIPATIGVQANEIVAERMRDDDRGHGHGPEKLGRLRRAVAEPPVPVVGDELPATTNAMVGLNARHGLGPRGRLRTRLAGFRALHPTG